MDAETKAEMTDSKNTTIPFSNKSEYPNKEFIELNIINDAIKRKTGVVISSYFLKKSLTVSLIVNNCDIYYLSFLSLASLVPRYT